MKQQAEPHLAVEATSLSGDSLRILRDLLKQTENPPQGLPEDAEEIIEELREKINGHLEDHLNVLKSRRLALLDAEWKKYAAFMKQHDFKSAALFTTNAKAFSPKLSEMLKTDAVLTEGFFNRARQNLTKLEGKSIRIDGIGYTVSRVDGNSFFVKQGDDEAKMGFEKLGKQTILELSLAGLDNARAAARQKGLYLFYFGGLDEAVKAMKEAFNRGEVMTFYESRLLPLLLVSSVPAGAIVTIEMSLGDHEWKRYPKQQVSPARLEVIPNTQYRVTIDKEGYQAEVQTIEIKGGGEYQIRKTLLKGAMPLTLKPDFEIPKGDRDEYGNPIRKGFGKSGLPKEIRHTASGIHLILIPTGEFMMGSPDEEQDRTRRPKLMGPSEEGPQHLVNITRPFYLGKYEFRQKDWKYGGGHVLTQKRKNDRLPIQRMNWDGAQKILRR
ncbi:MAG: PEGA domain-containing protein, partial [Planctomycetota bacterium]|nr:PEGA domain-containing protein [Planctomycetota bacterium]